MALLGYVVVVSVDEGKADYLVPGDQEKPGEAALTGGACSLWRVAGWSSTFSSSRWAALPVDTEFLAQRCLPRFFPVSRYDRNEPMKNHHMIHLWQVFSLPCHTR